MAITTTVNTDRVPTNKKPSGYSDPAVAALSGSIGQSKFSTEIDGTGNVDADEATAFTNIRDDVATWVADTYLPSLGVDDTQTITAVVFLESVDFKSSAQFTTDNLAFICGGVVTWKVA